MFTIENMINIDEKKRKNMKIMPCKADGGWWQFPSVRVMAPKATPGSRFTEGDWVWKTVWQLTATALSPLRVGMLLRV